MKKAMSTTMEQLIERLQQNQERTVRLVLTQGIPQNVFESFLAALQVNESVVDVQVLCCRSFCRQPSAESIWKPLLKSISCLPRLQRLAIRGYQAGCVLPLNVFEGIEMSSEELQSFTISRVYLGMGMSAASAAESSAVVALESSPELVGFTSFLETLESLQEFRMTAIGLKEDHTTSDLMPVLKTLGSLPRLANLEVSNTSTSLGVVEEVPASVFQSKTLKRLSISDFIFPEQTLEDVLNLLESNSTLEEVALSGDLTTALAPKMTEFLQDNATLKALALRLETLVETDTCEELVNAIGASHLEVVSLCSFDGVELSEQACESFVEMVKTNVNLEYLYVPCPFSNTAFWEPVRLYLGLNSAGRKDLAKLQKQEQSKEAKLFAQSIKQVSTSLRGILQADSVLPSPENKQSSMSQTCSKRDNLLEAMRLSKKQRASAKMILDSAPKELPTRGLASLFIS